MFLHDDHVTLPRESLIIVAMRCVAFWISGTGLVAFRRINDCNSAQERVFSLEIQAWNINFGCQYAEYLVVLEERRWTLY